MAFASAASSASGRSNVLAAASPTSAPWSSLTLNVLSSVPTNTINPGAAPASIAYSLDGGSSFKTIFSIGPATTRAMTTDQVSLPLNQNLALVQVQCAVFRNNGTTQVVTLKVLKRGYWGSSTSKQRKIMETIQVNDTDIRCSHEKIGRAH